MRVKQLIRTIKDDPFHARNEPVYVYGEIQVFKGMGGSGYPYERFGTRFDVGDIVVRIDRPEEYYESIGRGKWVAE